MEESKLITTLTEEIRAIIDAELSRKLVVHADLNPVFEDLDTPHETQIHPRSHQSRS